MFIRVFGEFLIKNNKITEDQYNTVMELQRSERARLGVVAITKKWLTQEQAQEIHCIQSEKDMRFGDIAVNQGYMTREQVNELLGQQGNPYIKFGQVLVNERLMTVEQLKEEIHEFEGEYGLSDTQFEAIISNDIDQAAQIILDVEDDFLSQYLNMILRNFNRFISQDFYFKSSKKVRKIMATRACIQRMTGDHQIFFAIAGDEPGLLAIAEAFVYEEYQKLSEEAYGAVQEFMNCCNGLFASKLSGEGIEEEVMLPEHYEQICLCSEKEFYVIPVILGTNCMQIVVGIDQEIL